MHDEIGNTLELDDIQSGVLRPRPSPFAATYIALRIDDRSSGRELLRRISEVVSSCADPQSPLTDAWVSVALTCSGMRTLGVPEPALETMAWEFREGMLARAKELGGVGESAPENWEAPFQTSSVQIVVV